MRKMTQRRQRFNHLIGVDRCRVVYRFADESIQTQSFDERTEDQAKATAAANLSPFGNDRPVSIEIYLGQFVAKGATDCEWSDVRQLATGEPTPKGIQWAAADRSTPPNGDHSQLGLFGGGAAA